MDLAQRAVGFDQRVQRDGAVEAGVARDGIDRLGRALQVGDAPTLGTIRYATRAPARPTSVCATVSKRGVVDRGQARADAVEAVVRTGQQLGDQLRVLGLAADRGAVLRVERDVEHRAEFGLQFQALAHARLDAGVVVAHRQGRQRLAGAEEGSAGMDAHACHPAQPAVTRTGAPSWRGLGGAVRTVRRTCGDRRSQQVLDAVLLAGQFGQRLVDAAPG